MAIVEYKERRAKGMSISEKKKYISLLFYMPSLPLYTCGTTVHTLKTLEAMHKVLPEKYMLNICINKDVDKHYGISKKYPRTRVVDLFDLDDSYDIAFVPSHIYSGDVNELAILDNHTDKWVMWIMDSIYLMYTEEDKARRVHALAKQCIDNLDGMIFFSNAVKEDLRKQFPSCVNMDNAMYRIVPIVGNYSYDREKRYDKVLPFKDYVLVIGNTYKHKMIPETIEVVRETDNNYIVVGAEKEYKPYENVYCYTSGVLSDEMMCNLYARCTALIFPSVYEGFGLPVVEALNFGKDVIAVNNELNHELEMLCDSFAGHIHYYTDSNQIPRALNEISEGNALEPNTYKRTWDDVARDVFGLLEEVISGPHDLERLNRRHFGYDLVDGSLYLRHKTLVNIVSADYTRCNYNGVIDIYGFGVNGKTFYNLIKNIADVRYVIDRKELDIKDDVKRVTMSNYKYEEGYLVVVTPEYDYGKIKKDFCNLDSRFEDSIICVSDFIDEYIAGEE